MDAWLKDYLLGNSERIFRKQLSADEVASGYHSCVSQRGSYEPTFRMKVNLHEKGVRSGTWRATYALRPNTGAISPPSPGCRSLTSGSWAASLALF